MVLIFCTDGFVGLLPNSFLTKTGIFSVMIRTLLYGFSSCKHHSDLAGEIHMFETLTKEGCSSWTFL